MKKTLALILSIASCCFHAASARAGSEDSTVECVKSAAFLAPLDSPEHRKYAPDKEVKVLHLVLDVTPDFKKRTIEASTIIRFKPVIKPARELSLDAVGLDIHSVTSTEKIQAWQVTSDHLVITFASPAPADHEASVTIAYHAEPELGLYFRTPEMGYKEGDTHLFSQGEAIEARHWYPCFDSPNEKFTSEVTCHVPEGMTVVSNGRLVSETKAASSGMVAFHWSQEKPHANYLITLVAGYFKRIEDRHNNVELAFLTPPSEIREAMGSFRDTRDIMEFFEGEIGVAYPWPKYYQVCVNDFVAGGMENTSATTLTDNTLFTDASGNIRNSEGLVSHEMAHQWFGDLVTCKEWSDLWLNEGFATFYAHLYDGHKNGRDSMLYGFYHDAAGILGVANDNTPIVHHTYDSPMDMFGYLAYPKGGWVLRMLRSQLGDDLYRLSIKTYLERHLYGNVVTEDLRSVIEELSGRSFDQFFDQYVYHAHHPEISAGYEWDEKTKLAKISIHQNQKLDENVLLFNFPLPVRFKGAFGTIDRTIQVRQKEEDFYFPLDSAPEIVRLDPGLTLLAKTTFNPPSPMLHAQLADDSDVIGRILAVEQLSGRKDNDSVTRLAHVLTHDSFYGVRVEASKALRSIHSDEALEALLAARDQSDARVRRQVAQDLDGFYRDTVRLAAKTVLDQEKNPEILAAAIHSLGRYASPETRQTLIRFLNTNSYKELLADAAVAAIRLQDDPSFVEPLLDTLSEREAEFTSRGYAEGLRTVAYLARNEEKKGRVREFLLGKLNHKKQAVRVAAINALGTLGDPKALAALETFATASAQSPWRSAAEQAVSQLRAARRPVDDFKTLRQEVLDLEKSDRDLRKEFEDLRKKLEAKHSAEAKAGAGPKEARAAPEAK